MCVCVPHLNVFHVVSRTRPIPSSFSQVVLRQFVRSVDRLSTCPSRANAWHPKCRGPCFCFHERHHLAPPLISLSASICSQKTSTTLPARHVRAVLKLLVVPSPFCPRDSAVSCLDADPRRLHLAFFSVIQHPRFTSDVFFCAQLLYAPASALPAPDNHATRLFADPRQPRTRCPVSQLWMSVFSQPCGTLAIACDVMFPATHATSHAPESDLSINASSYSVHRTFGSPNIQPYVLLGSVSWLQFVHIRPCL